MQKKLDIGTLEYLKAKEADLTKRLEVVREMMKDFKGGNDTSMSYRSSDNEDLANTERFDGYDKKWPLITKFKFILSKEKRFLHFREVGDIIVSLEGRGDPKELGRKLSSSTAPLKKKRSIVKYKASSSNQDTFWGSPKWFDENEKIKPGHEYNEDYLYKSTLNSGPDFEI